LKKRATIVDYGLGNLHSVANALRFLGIEVILADTAKSVSDASHLILPGVGAFADGMAGLQQRGQDAAILDYVKSGRGPLLGICLGAQLLLGESEEFVRTKGLGVVPGKVSVIPSNGQKVPHVGWKQVHLTEHGRAQSIVENWTWAYFVHSFHVVPENPEHILATAPYGESLVTAMSGRDTVFGCQFHPEKSGLAGLQIFAAFMKL
jgi:glutamine amidotransferase